MAAPKGNQYWKLAHNWRKPKKYTPDELLQNAFEYMKWCENNPLYEMKAFASQGNVIKAKLPKMRAMTTQGFCFFCNMMPATFYGYEKDEGYVNTITRIREMFYTQKIEGASADLLNPNIIARELKLTDRQEITTKTEQPLFPDVPKDDSNK
jgi:hypothetical protein